MPAPLRIFSEDIPSRMQEPQLYAKTPEHAIDDPRLNGTQCRVLVALAFLGRNSFPEVHASHAQVADKARTSTRTVRRAMAQLEKFGYAVQKGERLIVLSYETRAPFTLDSAPAKRGQKRSERPKVAAPARTNLAALARPSLAAPSLFEKRELNQRELASSSLAVQGPATTPAELNPDPPLVPRRPPPDEEHLANLISTAAGEGPWPRTARAILLHMRDEGEIGPERIVNAWPRKRRGILQPKENRLREPLGKVPPQPAGASTQQFPEPVYPTGQTDTKTEEPMPASKCPL